MEEKYKIDPNMKLNIDFEKIILKETENIEDPYEYAFKVYLSLCTHTKFDPNMLATGYDLKNNYVIKKINQEIDEITIDKNNMTCKLWSELYAYFLQKRGFNSYVVGTPQHKQVEAFLDNLKIVADATNKTHNEEDNTLLTDLSRVRLGGKPAGFKILSENGKEIETDSQKQMPILPQRYSAYVKNKEDFENIKISMFQNLPNDGISEKNIDSILTKICFINDKMQKEKLPNIENIQYLIDMFYKVFELREKEHVKLHSKPLAQDLYSENCKILSVISVYFGKEIWLPISEREDKYYRYVIFNPDTYKLEVITKEQLVENIKKGKYTVTKNANIDGIPELGNIEKEENIR